MPYFKTSSKELNEAILTAQIGALGLKAVSIANEMETYGAVWIAFDDPQPTEEQLIDIRAIVDGHEAYLASLQTAADQQKEERASLQGEKASPLLASLSEALGTLDSITWSKLDSAAKSEALRAALVAGLNVLIAVVKFARWI